MDAYIYQGDIYCEPCAEVIKDQQHSQAGVYDDAENTYTEDSDLWPQGPIAEGGGEADVPQHCAECQRFLENPLTDEGYRYVRLALEEERATGDVVAEWAEFYRDGLADADPIIPFDGKWMRESAANAIDDARKAASLAGSTVLSPLDRAVIKSAADFLQRDIIFDEESLYSDQLAEKLRALLDRD